MASLFHLSRGTLGLRSFPVSFYSRFGNGAGYRLRVKASGVSSSSLGPAGLFFVTAVQSRAKGERRLEVGKRQKAGVPGWMQRGLLKAPSVRGEVSSVNGSSGRPEAGMKRGQRSCQGKRSAGCSTWLFNFALLSLRSFFHLMLCKNWFYLPLIPPPPALLWMNN